MRVATTCNLALDRRVSDRQLAFYQTIARGGAGTIVTENMRVTLAGAPPNALVASDRDSIPGFRKLAELVHAEGALLIGQINHGGRQHLMRRVPPALVAPSAIPCPRSGGVPHELTAHEIRELIDAFVQSAVNCMEADFDGVEIHCAQGHLMQQFLSPYSNQREDIYGGSFENRLRFVRDVITGIRKKVGGDVLLGMRLGIDEFSDGGLEIDDTLEIARTFSQPDGVNYISLSQGNFNSIETHLPDRHFPIMPYRALQGRFKRELPNLTVVSNTRVQTPAQAEQMLSAGEADLVGLCRALIADPDWPNKSKQGRSHDIRLCISCNQCWGWLSDGEPMACSTNPAAGQELTLGEMTPAGMPRRVTVVGGGPAGLEAARIAALRGHRVTLFERDAELGGKIRTTRTVRNFEEASHLLDFLIPQARKAGATIRLGIHVTPEVLMSAEPDVVIVATGSIPIAPPIPGDGSVPVVPCDGILPDWLPQHSNIVVVDDDGYYWPSAVAEAAVQMGHHVTVVTRMFEPFREMPMVSRITTLRMLDQHGAAIQPNAEIGRVEAGGIVLRHYLSGREWRLNEIAAVLWTGLQRTSSLDCKALNNPEIHIIGDAVSPRRLVNALTEAHLLARKI